VLEPEGNSPLGTPKHKWERSIKMDVSQVGLVSMDRLFLTKDRRSWRTVVNMVMNMWRT